MLTFINAIDLDSSLFDAFKINSEDFSLIMKGIFNDELRVRLAFSKHFGSIPSLIEQAKKKGSLDFLMQELHKKYFGKTERQSTNTHEYFVLFNKLIKTKSEIIQNGLGLYDDLKPLLKSVMNQVRDEQRKKEELTAPETPEEEIKAEAEAEEKENLCVDLILFTKNLVNSSGTEGKQLVDQENLVQRYFEDYLFASHYKQAGKEDQNSAK